MSEALASLATEDAIAKRVTPFGKRVEIVKIANCALYGVRFKEGGELPDNDRYQLRTGKFTSAEEAGKAIDVYLRELWSQVDEARAKAEKRRPKEQVEDNG